VFLLKGPEKSSEKEFSRRTGNWDLGFLIVVNKIKGALKIQVSSENGIYSYAGF